MQVQDDLDKGVVGAVPIPSDNAGKEEVVAALVANVEAMIRADRKITALKQLQVSKTGLKKYDHYEAHLVGIADISYAGSYMAYGISERRIGGSSF